jgi:hypothetical protein
MSERINFRVLNIEVDPATQGYQEGTYNLLVAACVSLTLS